MSPCPNAESITAPSQGEIPKPFSYYLAEYFQFEMVPFETSPADCPVFYTCEMISGPTNQDLCKSFGGEESI